MDRKIMIEGIVQCPQCSYYNIEHSRYDESSVNTAICEDCGCEFQYRYEIRMIVEDTTIKKKGTYWEEE